MTAFYLTRPIRLAGQANVSLSGSFVAGSSTPTANTFTLSGPTTGTTGSPSTFTVTPNGQMAATVVVTPAATNAGSLVPLTLTFSIGSSAAQSFSVTRASDGTSVISITNNGGLSNAGTPISYTSSAASSGTLSTSFTLTSTNTNAAAPFTIGHAFKQTEVPTGSGVAVSGATAQVTPITLWPDGSLKFAIVAGTAPLTANVAATVSMVSASSYSSGTALTTTDLKNTGITASIDCGAFGLASWAGTDWDTPIYTQVSGHRMSSWQYRKAVGSDPHLVAWLEVRVYAGGAVEVLPWVEVGFLTGTAPANKSATYTFTLGGTQRFSALIDVKHRTRVPLLSGTGVFSHWLGTAPNVTPKHNIAYLISSKMVPKYGFTTPASATLDAQPQGYTPNMLGGISSSMGVAGSSAALISNQQAYYITSNGDPRAWRGALAFGLSGGSWSTHYRDETTQQVPKFGDYPNLTFQGGGSPTAPAGTGGTNGSPVTTHQPSYGYLPFLISGWFWFWEEGAFWTTWNYFMSPLSNRRGETSFGTGPWRNALSSAGVADSRAGAYANRGAWWTLRTLSQTLALCPPSHSTFNDWKTAWEANTDFYNATYVTGVHAPGWVSPQGVMGEYGSVSAYGTPGGNNSWWGAGWMNMFGIQAWGFASDLGLPQSATSLTNHTAIRDHAYKQVVGRADDGIGGNYNWRRFGIYDYPLGSDSTGMPVETWYTSAQSYANYVSGKGLASLPATTGLTLKSHSTDIDLAAGMSTASDYLPFALSALAFAVDHGAPGASAGWLRVTSASNFASALAPLNDNPEHGIYPRTNTALPAWLQGRAINEWFEIPGTNLSSAPPSQGAQFGDPAAKITGWCGAALRRSSSTYLIGAAGGHGDYGGNEVNALNLESDTPTWKELRASSTLANMVDFSSVYLDYRPGATHLYWTLQFINQLDRLVVVPQAAMGGSALPDASPAWLAEFPGGQLMCSFTAADWNAPNAGNDWDAAYIQTNRTSFLARRPVTGGDSAASLCCSDPSTGDIYSARNDGFAFRKWTRATNSWSVLPNQINASYAGSAIDWTRGQMLVVGDFSQTVAPRMFSTSNGALMSVTFGGLGPDVLKMGNYPCVVYDEINDRFLVFKNASPVVCYAVHPVTYAVTLVSTPNAPAARANGLQNSIQYVPNLKCLVMAHSYTGNCLAMRLA